MLYTTITVREKELKLRLDANMTVQIEKAIGKNPLNVVMGMNDGEMPKRKVQSWLYHDKGMGVIRRICS